MHLVPVLECAAMHAAVPGTFLEDGKNVSSDAFKTAQKTCFSDGLSKCGAIGMLRIGMFEKERGSRAHGVRALRAGSAAPNSIKLYSYTAAGPQALNYA